MKILWASNSPFTTAGYSQQTKLFCPKIRDLGHDIAIVCSWNFGSLMTWDGMKVYPSYLADMANDIIVPHAGDHFGKIRDGAVITLLDTWVLSVEAYQRLNYYPWCPIDHDKAPPPVLRFLSKTNAKPIAMSKFGKAKLEEAGFNPYYVPLGVNTKAFYPRDKALARKQFDIPEDAFVAGMVAVNKGKFSRKSFVECLEAFAIFHKKHPDSIIYIHTEATGSLLDGVRLKPMAAALGLTEKNVLFCDQYKYAIGYSEDEMANLFSSFDVLLSPSQGEGFGLAVLEAQACGTPAIASDFTAQTELVKRGWLIQEGIKYLTNLESYQFIPSVPAIAEALEEAYKAKDDSAMAKDNVSFAAAYDADLITQTYWKPVLEEIDIELKANNLNLNKPKKTKNPKGELISVIVSTKDPTADSVQLCLKAIMKSTAKHEIITITRNQDWTFSSAVNQGIQAAKGEYIVLLNDDCYLEANTLELMRETCSQANAGVVGAMLYYPNGSIQHAGGYGVKTNGMGLPTMEYGNMLQGQQSITGQEAVDDQLRDVEFITGALFMTKRSVLNKVGLLDESFASYFEDVDLCIRIREAGYRILLDPRATAVHVQSASMSQDPEAAERFKQSERRMIEKHA